MARGPARFAPGRDRGQPLGRTAGQPRPHGLSSRALADSGLAPELLCLEITETAMLQDPESIGETLRALGALGVRLALDDFGTGYSSLAYLPHLPLDTLKIDRSFVDGLGTEKQDTAIAEAIIAMSRALSLGVVAEGVETHCQIEELARLGCEYAQGYYFARPMPAGEHPCTVDRAAGPRRPLLTGRRSAAAARDARGVQRAHLRLFVARCQTPSRPPSAADGLELTARACDALLGTTAGHPGGDRHRLHAARPARALRADVASAGARGAAARRAGDGLTAVSSPTTRRRAAASLWP